MPPEAPGPRYGPALLPPTEVYAMVRENGFLPLGIPQQHGLVYTIAVIDRGGDDGRLVIDARNGRIIRFVPADRMGDNFDEGLRGSYGAVGSLPPVSAVRGPPRPPASIRMSQAARPRCRCRERRRRAMVEAKPLAAEPAPRRRSSPRRCRPNRPIHKRPRKWCARDRRSKTRRAANPADAGNAEGAGARVASQ